MLYSFKRVARRKLLSKFLRQNFKGKKVLSTCLSSI